MISQYFFRHQGVAPYESRDAPDEKTDAPPHLTKFKDRLSDAEFGKNAANLSNQFAAQGVAPYESRDAPADNKTDAPPPLRGSYLLRRPCESV